MIVQPRVSSLRLIRQHDHAMASGRLAHAWRPGGEPLPFRLVTAVGLHDVAWRELDSGVRHDPSTGRPHDFSSYPLDDKLRAYRSGLDEMEAVDPWVGMLGSLHYASFLDEERAPGFLASERERQDRLRAALERRCAGRHGPGDGAAGAAGPGGRGEGDAARPGGSPGAGLGDRLRRHLRWLKFFDGLSLRLCLSPPGVSDEDLPGWMDRAAPLTPPEGERIVPRWRSDDRVELPGAPLPAAVTLGIPVRDVPGRSFPDGEALVRAWREAREGTWRLEVAPRS